MKYLYHRLPDDMKGNVLYPLNFLNKKYPGVYRQEVKKYLNRKYVLKVKIPIFNCLWNDVLHLTTVHPVRIRRLLDRAKVKSSKRTYVKIPIDLLDKKKMIVYLFRYKTKDFHSIDQFEMFTLQNFKKYSRLRPKTLEYYKKEVSEKRRPLLYMYIPHILYKGTIDIDGLEVVSV